MVLMSSIRLMLTILPDMHDAILAKARERFMTPQEFIVDAARRELLKPKDHKAGRPSSAKKKQFEDYFSKKGGK